jgi:hypothetical protein
MTAVDRRVPANSPHGTMLTVLAYTRDTERLRAVGVWLRAALPGNP